MKRLSSQLASQTLSKRAIADCLIYLGSTKWQKKYNTHDLTIEAWTVGIWVKEVGTIISYRDLAEFIRETTKLKASALQIQRRGSALFLVQGSQQPWYAVTNFGGNFQCECMLWRCRHNRIKQELPQLFKALGNTIYCHHTVAAETAMDE